MTTVIDLHGRSLLTLTDYSAATRSATSSTSRPS